MLLQLHFKHHWSNSARRSQMSFYQMFCAICFFMYVTIPPNNTSGETPGRYAQIFKNVGPACPMSVLTQWHNSCATCSGFRATRADVPCLKMKALSGRLLQRVTGCKRQREEDGRRSASMAASQGSHKAVQCWNPGGRNHPWMVFSAISVCEMSH